MPFVSVQANVGKSEGFNKKLSEAVAAYLSKPEQYVMVKFEKADLMFGGTEEPAAFVDVRALGMSVEKTNYKEFCKVLSSLLNKELSIPEERIFYNFTEVERTHWGMGNKTFA